MYYSIYVRGFLSYLELTYIPFGNKMSRAVVNVSTYAHYQKTDTLILIKDCFNYCMHALEGYKLNRVFTRIVLIKWRTLKCMFYFTTLAPWRSYATCRRLTPPHSPGLHLALLTFQVYVINLRWVTYYIVGGYMKHFVLCSSVRF